MKPVELMAMREACRVGGWEIPSEFSLNSPNSPAELMHWRALIKLLGLMPGPMRDVLCSLRFPLASSQGIRSSGEPPAVRPKVVRPEEPMDWSQGRMSSGGSVRRVPGEGQRVTPRASACGFSAPQPVPLFSFNPAPSPIWSALVGMPLSQWLGASGRG